MSPMDSAPAISILMVCMGSMPTETIYPQNKIQ
jgi:hypothetical protein